MAQQSKISRNNTRVTMTPGQTIVRLHGTDVVTFRPNEIILDNGGWVTSTTVTRMNQTSKQFGLGYYVSRKNGDMIVSYQGQAMPFVGNSITLNR